MKTIANLKATQKRHAMTNKQKCHLLTTLILGIACLPAFSGCSSLDSTTKNQRVLLLKSVGQEHQQSANPAVRPAQPYMLDPEKSLD